MREISAELRMPSLDQPVTFAGALTYGTRPIALAASAELIRKAYDACLIGGEKTKDLGGELGTSDFADAVIARL